MNSDDKVIFKAITKANEEDEKREKIELNFDLEYWQRECKEEILEPIDGVKSGKLPDWLAGTLLRNGPGKLSFGTSTFKHLFDGSALIHRFEIKDGKATYQCRFLPTRTYKDNLANQRIVYSEFGTQAVPDPCLTIFQRISSIFQASPSSDNCDVSIYPFGDEIYALTESPRMHRIDTVTLDSIRSVDSDKKLHIVHHSAHPHVMQDGSVYNVGLCTESKPKYSIVSFPKTKKGEKKESEDVFDEASIVASIPSRWPFYPGYMHSFGITDSYFLIIEQPFCLSVPNTWTMKFTKNDFASMFKWYEKEDTLIHVVSRENGNLVKTFHCEPFFFFHTINQYEEDGHIIFDVCVYKDGTVVSGLYFTEMEKAKTDYLTYAKKFKTRPVRFVLPLEGEGDENLVKLPNTEAKAWTTPNGQVWAKPELLTDSTLELPRINYPLYNGKKYRYFYGMGMGMVDKEVGGVIKIDIVEKTKKVWLEPSAHASEPIFVPSPNAKDEDDGVILTSLSFTGEKKVALLVLDGKTLEEISRTVFDTPSDVPFTFHGWFADQDWPSQN